MDEKFTKEEWQACLKVLNILKRNPQENPDNQQFKTLITSIHKQAKKLNKLVESNERKAELFKTLAKSTIVSEALNTNTRFAHENETDQHFTLLAKAINCYSCNKPYNQLHFFYHRLCPECAELNYNHRKQTHDFSEYNIIITGGRVKIGYATALKFLRSGADVTLTTRFPAIALEQLQEEVDFEQWSNRLTIYGLDLRNLSAVNAFINYYKKNHGHLDVLVNNAAQTIKYPLSYYEPLLAKEKQLLIHPSTEKLISNQTSLGTGEEFVLALGNETSFEANRFGQPIDHREKNSWNSTLTEIDLEELLEVNLINQISPYQLIAGLKDMMVRSPHQERFIINVTSSEGKFSYTNKTIFHPHTNMTKAALNMLTRTSGAEFIADNIYMTAVDVGWISTGVSESMKQKQFENMKVPPLDPLDGACRIIHAVDAVIKGDKSLYGILLRNYVRSNW